jgi:hypothetical protein
LVPKQESPICWEAAKSSSGGFADEIAAAPISEKTC